MITFYKLVLPKILLISIILMSCKKKNNTPPEPIPDYNNFKITSLKLTEMPFLDQNSSGWDPFDGPDVFFNITDGTNINFNGSSSKVNNVLTTNLPLNWNFSNSFQIQDITTNQYIDIWDYDTLDPNDFIGSVSFKLEDYKNGYPSTITKSNGSISITITGEWY